MSLGIGVTSRSNLTNLRKQQILHNSTLVKFELVDSMNEKLLSVSTAKSLSFALSHSTSQLGQDLLAFVLSGCKSAGFFVEFGATNGKDLSNTYMLEKKFGWNGILAEPAKSWHKELKHNRDCSIEFDCVWKESNAELIFNEVPYLELSTIDSFSSGDMHSQDRQSGNRYPVNTITLNEMLVKYSAPHDIDYLSIDTEGSEYEILNSFDFSKHQFSYISSEHNFTNNRESIVELLSTKGYKRILENVSRFDDWFVHESLLETKGFI
jgi:FkbM family methyltransferase